MSGPFNVGDVVVCVDDAARGNAIVWPWCVTKGAYYRIKWVGEFIDDEPAVLLEEDPFHDDDSAWDADRFRPVPKASDEFTHQMRALRPTKEPVA